MPWRKAAPKLISLSEPFEMAAPLVIDDGVGRELTRTAVFGPVRADVPQFTVAFTGGAVKKGDRVQPVIAVKVTSVGTMERGGRAVPIELSGMFRRKDDAVVRAHTAIRDLTEEQIRSLLHQAAPWLKAEDRATS